ncbi:MAG: hypothetical protein RBS39_03235 [Phycisphaerales bacterium]|jgi:type II secretory pathway component GspD/PulD (secretin)|nr:hypothetical protein [Phycisphaerales bacterium]
MFTSAGRAGVGRGIGAARIAALVAVQGLAIGLATNPASAGVDVTTTLVASDPALVLDQAASLATEGRLVYARRLLIELSSPARSASLSVEQSQQLAGLFRRVSERLAKLDPVELSLQKAELAVVENDLVTAERQGRAAMAMVEDDAQRARALEVQARVDSQRAEIASEFDVLLARGHEALSMGRLDEAAALASALNRAGLPLAGDRADALDALLGDVSDARLGAEGFAAAAAFEQPGTVRRQEQQPGDEAAPPVEDLPDDDASSAQPEQPPAQGEDVIRAAREQAAQTLLSEADAAFDAQRYQEAIDKYEQVTRAQREFLPAGEVQRAQQRLTDARLLLRGNLGPGDSVLGQEIGRQALVRQQTDAEFNNLLQQAQAQLSSGDAQGARQSVARAEFTLNSARGFFAEADYRARLDKATQLKTQIDQREDEIRRRAVDQRTRELEQQARERESQLQADKDRRIREAIERARALQQESKYAEALEVVNQVLFLDPVNPAGLLLRDLLEDSLVYRQYQGIQRDKEQSYSFQAIQNEEAMRAPRNVIEYPTDWPRISQARGEAGAYVEPPENRAVLATIEGTRMPARFSDNTLRDALNYVATYTRLNIDVDWNSLDEIGISGDDLVTLTLSDVPASVVLDRVLDKVSPDDLSRASWAVRDGILTVGSKESLDTYRVLHVYDIRDLVIEVPDWEEAPEFDLQSVLQSSQGGGGQSPFTDANDDDRERIPLEDRVQEIVDLIQQLIDFEGWQDNGGSVGSISPLAAQLVIVNTPRNHREIKGLLDTLRAQRAMQINVETRFLLVNQDYFEQIGFDLDIYFNSNNNQVRAARAGDPTIQASDYFDFTQGGLKRAVTGAVAPNAPATTVANTALTQGVVNPRSTSVVGGEQNSLGIAEGAAGGAGLGDFATGVLTAAPALGIAGQFLDDIQVDFLIKATQADQRSVTLTAPRLTFTNGQIANIYVVTQTSFVSDLQPVVSDSAVGFDPEVDVVSEGVLLLVDGVVSADRRYVTMNVDAAVATVDDFGEETVTAVAGGQLVNSADTGSVVQLPVVTVTRVQTTVTVPDQGTILLGGQRLVSEYEVESGVPVLSKIPIINRFFSNRIEAKEESTLMILLKPTVLIQNEEEEKNFPGLIDSLGLGG